MMFTSDIDEIDNLFMISLVCRKSNLFYKNQFSPKISLTNFMMQGHNFSIAHLYWLFPHKS